ncbi:MAG: hypothetical protein IIZ39_05935 [Blautia sp.]|nr:hypothetical protein [Blautia sp.]
MEQVPISRIRIFAHRNLIGTNRRTIWSMLVGGEGYEVDLPPYFHIENDANGNPLIVAPDGQAYQPPSIICGDIKPYLKINFKVYPLSHLERVT